MKKGSFISVSAVAMLSVVFSFPAFCEVVARYGGPLGRHEANAIATDASGNVYVTGYSGGDHVDYATVAYDSNLNRLWVRRYTGPLGGNSVAHAIATDSFGNVYVTGVTGQPDRGGITTSDYATVAYNSSGNWLWTRRYNGPANGSDGASAIATDAFGHIYVTGSSTGSGGVGYLDYATVAYDSSGTRLWARRYGTGDGLNRSSAIATDASGNVYVTGSSLYINGNFYAYATVAYDSSGTLLWVRRYYGPTNGNDQATAIATDASDHVYVTGSSSSSTGTDYATLAYNSSGTLLWVRRYKGPTGANVATAMTTDASGNIYVTGWSGRSSNDPDGRVDYVTVAYNSSGTRLWARRYGTINDYYNYPAAIATDASGNVYVTGYSTDSEGREVYLTVAYDSRGNILWVRRNNGGVATAIATDASDNVYVTGSGAGGYVTVKYSSAGQ